MAILNEPQKKYCLDNLKVGDSVQVSLSGKKMQHKYLDCNIDGTYESHAFLAFQRIGRFNTYHLIFSDKAHIKFDQDGNIILDENHTIKRIIREESDEYQRLKTIDELVVE